MALLTCNINSFYLHGNTNINVIMPDRPWRATPEDHYSQKKEYKALWLLHGAGGDSSDWVRKSNIELYAAENDLVVIMPSGMNSSYTNQPGYAMYDFFLRELMPMMRAWLPISCKKEDNFIAGLSMGGNGATKFALLNPELFAGAASLSASPFPYEGLSMQEMNRGGMIDLYGTPEALLASDDNLWRVVKEKAQSNNLPKLYYSCGSEDKHIERCRSFWRYADEIGLPIVHEEFEGYVHEWRVWDLAIQHALKYFGFYTREGI